jgi:hypothetical protein
LKVKASLINEREKYFFKNYSLDQFTNLLERQEANRFDHLLLEGHPKHEIEFQKAYGLIGTRAYIIDKIFGFCSTPELQMVDKNIVYAAISIFDRYYEQLGQKFLAMKKLNPESCDNLQVIPHWDAQ